MRTSLLLAGSLILLSSCSSATGDVTQTKRILIKGSDTEVQLVSNLAEAFSVTHPDANISVTGGGSATGIAALLNGEADIANSSRPLSDKEREQAKERGLNVQEFILAADGLSIIVHPENPVPSLTVEQIGKIYAGTITNWKDVGGPDTPIVLYGRQSTSGTFTFFRDKVVKADYALSMRNMEGSQAIVDSVKTDKSGIGYVGVGYVKDAAGTPRTDVSILSVMTDAGTVSPLDEDAVKQGKYPIARPIYQYLAQAPAAGSLLQEFLRFEVSPDGEKIVKSTGFYTITAEDERKNNLVLPQGPQ